MTCYKQLFIMPVCPDVKISRIKTGGLMKMIWSPLFLCFSLLFVYSNITLYTSWLSTAHLLLIESVVINKIYYKFWDHRMPNRCVILNA